MIVKWIELEANHTYSHSIKDQNGQHFTSPPICLHCVVLEHTNLSTTLFISDIQLLVAITSMKCCWSVGHEMV